MRRLIGLLLLVLCGACSQAGSAMGGPYPVTNTNDSGEGSLRAAILAANAHMGADTIPIETTGTIELQSALQIIFSPVAITGPGAAQLEVHRSAVADFSVFAFATDAGPSSITGLTVSNGRAERGGGIRNVEGGLTLTGVVVQDSEAVVEGGTNFAEGGGVFSEGPLTLRETVVADNASRASDGTTLTAAFGGGVAALDDLVVEGSTISGNVAEASGAGSVSTAQGGGLAGNEATVSRSTISGNRVVAGGGAPQVRAQGGGLQIQEGTVTASTLSRNSATSAGLALGVNLNSVLSTSVGGTIVADPVGEADSCSGTLSSSGFNLDEDGSCEFEAATDLEAVDPLLGPLANNGGPTPTHAVLPGSAAIDRGSAFGAALDQRGLPRPVDFTTISNTEGGDGSDIGAFELQAPAPLAAAPILIRSVPGDRTPPNTRIVSGPPRVSFKTRARFRFASTEAQSRFQCKVDKGRWRGCRNPLKRNVSAGRKHLFKVRAIDRFGNVDPSPARFGWRVKKLGG